MQLLADAGEDDEGSLAAGGLPKSPGSIEGGAEFGHPSSFENTSPTPLVLNSKTPRVLNSKMGRKHGGKFHQRWKDLDEKYLKPWFGGLPRAPDALQSKLSNLQSELAKAQEKLEQERNAIGEREELVVNLHLEVVDTANQIALVANRARARSHRKAQEAVVRDGMGAE